MALHQRRWIYCLLVQVSFGAHKHASAGTTLIACMPETTYYQLLLNFAV
jgi:hypothetical protein